ncbi:hypothetical protein NC651_001168 [Populus alba x Populus x berolinensis]|nr:hypothetical protein NC651_001168 [Populus alba x Populus x berolinensis]
MKQQQLQTRGYLQRRALPQVQSVHQWMFMQAKAIRVSSAAMTTCGSRKAVHETVNDQLHVVHEGKLRIIIVHNLKILSWEFCSRDLEELCCLEVQFYLRCQEQDAATDGMTFDHKTLVAVASGMHQVVLWKIPEAGFMVASKCGFSYLVTILVSSTLYTR